MVGANNDAPVPDVKGIAVRHAHLTPALILLLIVVGLAANAQAQTGSTVFTYQGTLTDGAAAANGAYDFQFRLFDAPTAGNQVGPAVTRDDVIVQNGLFLVPLDFGAIFNGSARYLEISVRPGANTGELTVLTPRQEFTAAPMAIFSSASRVSDSALALHDRPVGNIAPTAGQTLKWNGSQWVPSADSDTIYSAGQGLSLVGTRFEVRFAGNGSSTFASRSDHIHFGELWAGSAGGTGLYIDNRSLDAGAFGVFGNSVNSVGVGGDSNTGSGVQGRSRSGIGVLAHGGAGRGISARGDAYGGIFFAQDRGVEIQSTNLGLLSIMSNRNNRAGEFQGNVAIFGNLSKSGGSFLIDHPLDPENKYLLHSFVESPDMMNVYNGNVTLDANGEATVALPEYFGALNIDYRYQLTPIGAPGPNLYIAEEIRANQFKIAGGTPGGKVSWQVTGIRNDAYARENRIVVEQDKPVAERGTYLYAPASNSGDATQDAPQAPRPIQGPSAPAQPNQDAQLQTAQP